MPASVTQLLQKTAADSQSWDMPGFLAEKNPRILAFLNAHAVTTAARTPAFANFLNDSDMLLRDGIGVKIGLMAFGLGKTKNLNGTDLITLILKETKDKKIVIFGASDETMQITSEKLATNGHNNIAATLHGFHDDELYLKTVKDVQPDIVLLCMGMPRQELLAAKLKENKFPGLVICGGGWADFYSAVKPRAPLWMRRWGMEWLYRLLQEPKRLGKRYTVDIIYFFYIVLKDRLKHGAPPTP